MARATQVSLARERVFAIIRHGRRFMRSVRRLWQGCINRLLSNDECIFPADCHLNRVRVAHNPQPQAETVSTSAHSLGPRVANVTNKRLATAPAMVQVAAQRAACAAIDHTAAMPRSNASAGPPMTPVRRIPIRPTRTSREHPRADNCCTC